jgi:hypothetical protein
MAQPCGEVCDRRSRYSMYMRSCPIFSLADAFPILTHLGFDPHSSFWLRISLQISIAQFIKLRFEDDMEKQRKLEITTFMCWLLFVLRPLSQVIRLTSFHGTPWTKLFGFSFLVPWVLVELLVFISESWAIEQGNAHTTYQSLNSLDRLCGIFGLVACFVHLISAFGGPLFFITGFTREKDADSNSLQWKNTRMDMSILLLPCYFYAFWIV